MKRTLTSLLLLTASLSAFSQIILTQSNMPVPPDTVPLLNVSSIVTTAPLSGSGQTWDYSTLNFSSATATFNEYVPVNNDPDFPTAQFVVRSNLKNLNAAVGYYMDQYYTINSNGVEMVGVHVPAQSYGLGTFTGNNSDTLYILDNILYYPATPRVIIGFPAANGSAWQTAIRHVVNMELSVSAASLNHTPMEHVFYYDRQDTVIGWGTLKLPAVSGYNTDLPVLQDRVIQYCVDSFYVGGSPAPAQLTTAFSMTQGQITGPKYNRVVMYREGAFNYQMLFNYTDNTFATLSSAYVSTMLPVATGISEAGADRVSAAYPNPFDGKDLYVTITDKSANPTTANLYDMTGRLAAQAAVTTESGAAHIRIGTALCNGIYTYELTDATHSHIGTGRVVVAK